MIAEFQPDCSKNTSSGLSLSETLVISRCISSESESVRCETFIKKHLAVISLQAEVLAISGQFLSLLEYSAKFDE